MPAGLSRLHQIRAELGSRLRRGLGWRDTAWLDLPPWFKRQLLERARLDPLRECMPLSTFDRDELEQLRRARVELEDLAGRAGRAMQ